MLQNLYFFAGGRNESTAAENFIPCSSSPTHSENSNPSSTEDSSLSNNLLSNGQRSQSHDLGVTECSDAEKLQKNNNYACPKSNDQFPSTSSQEASNQERISNEESDTASNSGGMEQLENKTVKSRYFTNQGN